MKSSTPYVPLRCKSNYSFLEGASHPEELVARCAELGIDALAVTDTDGVYGVVRAHVAAKEHGIKLIVGAELTVTGETFRGSETVGVGGTGGTDRPAGAAGKGGTIDPPVLTVILLSMNYTGYKNLCSLITTGRMRNEKGVCSVTFEEIMEYQKGLIPILAAGAENLASSEIKRLHRVFSSRLSIAVSRHREPGERAEENKRRRLAADTGVPLVAATEVLYHDRKRRSLQDVCRCIRTGITLFEAGNRLEVNDEHEIKSPGEIESLYKDIPDTIGRTRWIADRCTFSLDELVYRYPSEFLPEGYTTAEWLEALTFRGAGKRYPDGVPPAVRRQLESELQLIEELDYCGYFLTMWDIVELCRARGILCQGRGSAANSAVCYCLGITAVDPVRMDLLFERFISRERAEPPDIDLDIEHRRREEVIQHMYEKYGRKRAAMVANVVRYRTRSALREVGKVLGVPATTLDRLARLVSFRDSNPVSALKEAGLDMNDYRVGLLLRLAGEIREFPRHLSIHPGGFLLGSVPVSEMVPVENATMPGRTVIQWDKYDVEELGLFKVDLLGLGALTHLRFSFELLERRLGKRLTMAEIPAGDPKVYEMLERSDTVGVFQLESRAQMSMLPRMKPKRYYDIVIEISIVRPGPISGGMVHPYLRRRNGEEDVVYPHPSLEPVLRKTLGIPIFQEQVMRLAVVAAGYTPGEADQLRRDMAAWRRQGTIERHHDRFVEGMKNKGISKQFAEQVFDQIRGFGEYGFPESHAASFALIAYGTSWLRAYFPVIFTCALLNAWPMGFYAPATIVEDGKRHGIVFRQVDMWKSKWECTLEDLRGPERTDSVFTLGTEDARFAIRMGLSFVKGLGEKDYERLVEARNRLPGDRRPGTVEELIRISGLHEDTLSTLARSGAMDSIEPNRRSALWKSLGIRHDVSKHGDDLPFDPEALPGFRDLSTAETTEWDQRALSHSTHAHPLEPYREAFERNGFRDAAAIIELSHGDYAVYAGLVICRQRPETAGGTLFLTLEDESGFVNCIVWKRTFQRYRSVILTSRVMAVRGRVQKEGRVVHIVVERCWVPDIAERITGAKSRDFR